MKFLISIQHTLTAWKPTLRRWPVFSNDNKTNKGGAWWSMVWPQQFSTHEGRIEGAVNWMPNGRQSRELPVARKEKSAIIIYIVLGRILVRQRAYQWVYDSFCVSENQGRIPLQEPLKLKVVNLKDVFLRWSGSRSNKYARGKAMTFAEIKIQAYAVATGKTIPYQPIEEGNCGTGQYTQSWTRRSMPGPKRLPTRNDSTMGWGTDSLQTKTGQASPFFAIAKN